MLRYSPDGSKDSTMVHVPETLKLDTATYQLFGTVAHHGSRDKKGISRGHYTADIYDGGSVSRKNDSVARPLTADQARTSRGTALILGYQRVDAANSGIFM